MTQFGDSINNTVHGMLPSYNAHLPYRCSLNSTPAVNISVSGYICDAVVQLGENRWKFTLRSDAWVQQRAFYQQAIGNKDIVIGIKAKRGGQAYALSTRSFKLDTFDLIASNVACTCTTVVHTGALYDSGVLNLGNGLGVAFEDAMARSLAGSFSHAREFSSIRQMFLDATISLGRRLCYRQWRNHR